MRRNYKRTTNRLLSALMCIILCMSSLMLSGQLNVKAKTERQNKNKQTANITSGIQIGDTITMGNYDGKPIEWICASIDENGPLMLSKNVLCSKEFDAPGDDASFHSDSWGYIRKTYGSNCWVDSNIRQWLNTRGTVEYSHCNPSYAEEIGFLSSFSENELGNIKKVERVVNVNIMETRREGYCDGGSGDVYNPLNSDFEASSYYYKKVTDTFFLLDATQVHNIYYNDSSYLKTGELYYCGYAGGNNYACFEWVAGVNENGNVSPGLFRACYSYGIRPAFYLNASDHFWYFDADNTVLACRTCDKSYPLSPDLGFKYRKDNFSFEHTKIGSSAISFEGSKYMSELLKMDVFACIADTIIKSNNYRKNKMDEHKQQYGNWGGSCYGVASMISDFYSRLRPQKYGRDKAFELTISDADNLVINNDTRLKDSINIMMYSQMSVFNVGLSSGTKKLNKQLVDTARSLSSGAYPPIVKYNGHAVNLIGILPDDFDENAYVVVIYDCNYIGEARFILVDKDYKSAYLGEFKNGTEETPTIEGTADKNGNREYIAINDIITSSFMNNIDFWAPGLSTSPLYSSPFHSSTINKANQITAANNLEDVSQNHVRFLLASDGVLTVRGNDGTYFKYSNGSVIETNIEGLYSESFEADFGFYGVYVPYSTDKYEIISDGQYYANATYNDKISISYFESGGTSIVDLDGKVIVDAEKTNSYYEMAAFKYDMIKDSNVLSTAICGTNSKTSINYLNDYPEIESDDFEGISVSVQRDDSDMSVESVALEINENTKTIKLKNSPETQKIEVDYKNEKPSVKSVSIGDKTIDYKSSANLNPQIVADEGAKYTVTYKSSDQSVISVDNNGKVTSNKTFGFSQGSATITVTVTDENGNTVTDTCKVTVQFTALQWIIKIVLFGWIWY